MTDEYKRGLMRAAQIARSYDGGGIAGEKAHDIAEDIMAEIPGPMGERTAGLSARAGAGGDAKPRFTHADVGRWYEVMVDEPSSAPISSGTRVQLLKLCDDPDCEPGCGVVTGKWHVNPEALRAVDPAPTPTAVDGAVPPKRGDVWLYNGRAEVTFTGERDSAGRWKAHDGSFISVWRDEEFTDGTLVFIRPASPAGVEKGEG